MHIEQARVLQDTGNRIGIVTAIAGYVHADVVVHGRGDHAGATPMDFRLDPTLPLAETIVELERLAREAGRGHGGHGRRDRGRAGDHQRDRQPRPLLARHPWPGRRRVSPCRAATSPRSRSRRPRGRGMEAEVSQRQTLPATPLDEPDRRRARGGRQGDGRAVHDDALGSRPRHDVRRGARAERDGLRALQGRRQPPSGRGRRAGRRRARGRRSSSTRFRRCSRRSARPRAGSRARARSAAARAGRRRGSASRLRPRRFEANGDPPLLPLLGAVVVGLVRERERKDPLRDEVRAVDAREALRDDGADAEVERRERGLLAARALAVVVAADDDAAAPLLRAGRDSPGRSAGTCTGRRRGCSTRWRRRARRQAPCPRSRRRRARRSRRGPRSSPEAAAPRAAARCSSPSPARRRCRPQAGG